MKNSVLFWYTHKMIQLSPLILEYFFTLTHERKFLSIATIAHPFASGFGDHWSAHHSLLISNTSYEQNQSILCDFRVCFFSMFPNVITYFKIVFLFSHQYCFTLLYLVLFIHDLTVSRSFQIGHWWQKKLMTAPKPRVTSR